MIMSEQNYKKIEMMLREEARAHVDNLASYISMTIDDIINDAEFGYPDKNMWHFSTLVVGYVVGVKDNLRTAANNEVDHILYEYKDIFSALNEDEKAYDCIRWRAGGVIYKRLISLYCEREIAGSVIGVNMIMEAYKKAIPRSYIWEKFMSYVKAVHSESSNILNSELANVEVQ